MLGRRNDKRKSFFLLVLQYVVVTVLISIVVFSMIFYAECERILLAQSFTHAMGALRQSAALADDVDREINKFCMQLYSEDLVYQFAFSEDSNNFWVLDALKKMDSYRFVSSYISSVYVYSRQLDRVYLSAEGISNKVQSASDFYDQAFLSRINEHAESAPLKPFARRIPIEATGDSYVGYTYLFYDFARIEDANIIVGVNVGQRALQSALQSALQGADAETGFTSFLTDENGRVLTRTPFWADLENVGPFLSDVLDSSTETPAFLNRSIDGHACYLAASAPNRNGWRAVALVSVASIEGSLVSLRHKTLAIGGSIFLLGTALSVLMAYRLNKPVKRLQEQVSDLSSRHMDERYKRRQEIIHRLMLSSASEPSETELEELQLQLPEEGAYSVLLLQIDHYADYLADAGENAQLYKFGLCNIAEELLQPLCKTFSADMGEDCCALLFLAAAPLRPDEVRQTVCSLQEIVRSKLDFSVSCVWSTEVAHRNEIAYQYNQTRQYAAYRLFRGAGCYVDAAQEQERPQTAYPAQLERQASDALAIGSLAAARESYDALLDAIGQLAPRQLNLACGHMTYSLSTALESLKKNDFPSTAVNYNIEGLFGGCESVEQVKQRLSDMFDELDYLSANRKTDRQDAMVAKVREILEREYSNLNLSLNLIADEVDLTPNYVGRVFKRMTGASIPDTIMMLRIDKAKELLAATKLPINQLAERVGFAGDGYFYKAFKTHCGCTPADYRKRQRAKREESECQK